MNKTTAIVFFSILVVGLVISYFTLGKHIRPVEVTSDPVETGETGTPPAEKTAPEATPAEPVTASPGDPAPEADPAKPADSGQVAKPDPGPVTPPAAPEPAGFATPEAAMQSLADAVEGKDFEAFTGLVGEDAIASPIRAEVKSLIESPVLSLDGEKPFTEISKSATLVRWALNFVPAAGTTGASGPDAPAPTQLYADLESLGNNAFDFSRISLPLRPEAVASPSDPEVTTAPGSPAAPAPPAQEALPDDPLTIAHTFARAVVARDFRVARALADPEKVTDERVAALMIAVEEGKFALKEDRPLVVTLSREDITWVLTRIVSGETASEFAVELGRDAGPWVIGGLTFSKVLSALANQAGGGDVAYSPIVEDPAGGDSLVLYFEFDSAGITPRGKRQLAIIADILSQGAERVIRINGHADALGTDQYNETLSESRADAIRRGLIEMGVTPAQVITEGFGASKPRRPNFNPDGTDNPTGRSQNRRAEVYLDF